MKKSALFLTGISGILLVFGLVLAGCPTDAGGGGGGGNDTPTGVGSITITGIKAGLNDAKIVHNTVSGTHDTLGDFKVEGGQLSGAVLDRSGSSTVSGGNVTIPVRGIKGGSSYEFTDGKYSLKLTVSGATTAADNKEYTLDVTFSGSTGTAVANATNGLGL
jgi:hypothetical protein